MDAEKFMELFNSSQETSADLDETKDALRTILEDSSSYYYDVSGDGTQYLCSGVRFGVGFARCLLTLRPDGLAVVRAEAMPVPSGHERSMSRLCHTWSTSLKLEGLKVEDGHMVFESQPFDPLGTIDGDKAVGLALSTIGAYASAPLALEAGTEPWDLIDLGDARSPRGGGDGDGDGGESEAPSIEMLRTLLEHAKRSGASATTA